MKKNLPLAITVLFFCLFLTQNNIFKVESVLAQTTYSSPTPTLTSTIYPTSTLYPTSSSGATTSTTTKGGESTTSTLPSSLPVTGAYDYLILMVIGGMMMVGMAGVLRVKLTEVAETNEDLE